MKRRVVVTGMGALTPIGNTVEATWSALMSGKSGVGHITRFDTNGFAVKIAAELKDFNPHDFIKEDADRMGAFIHYAIAAADEAMRDSKLEITDAARVGTYIGNAFSDLNAIENDFKKLLEGGPHRVPPLLLLIATPHMAAMQVAMKVGTKGPSSATATACAAAAHAIGDSFKIIQRGDADAMICGGAESPITRLSIANFTKMKLLSKRNDEPEKASRPFHKDRDGFVVGEGAGIIILEELEQARQRGAHIYAEIVGYGMSTDATYPAMKPDETGEGARRAMQMAINDAGINPEDIGYINAYGSSSIIVDATETIAIRDTFGYHANNLAVSSTKSMTGHLLGASGGIEAIFSVMALHEGKLPPTINYVEDKKKPDPVCNLDYVPNEAREAQITYALSNSFGIGGTNAVLLFKKHEA